MLDVCLLVALYVRWSALSSSTTTMHTQEDTLADRTESEIREGTMAALVDMDRIRTCFQITTYA